VATPPAPPAPPDPLAWVMDVPCAVDFVLGTATITVRDCVNFAPGSIVRLKQTAGTDLELRVGGISVATGEGVMVDENLGVRLNRMLPPAAQEFL
jgi:flagellar motor switch protein FliN/FliY